MSTYTPLDPVMLKADSKARTFPRISSFIVVTLIGLLVSALAGMTRTEEVIIDGTRQIIRTTTTFSSLVSLLISPVVSVATARFYLTFLRYDATDVNVMRTVIPEYGRHLFGMLWMMLFVFLWSLLLIVPGIIKAIAYSMTPYILSDNPNVGYREAIKISMVLTDGRKGEIFRVMLSFIGWGLLCIVTAGIAAFWVSPMYSTCMAQVYEILKGDAIAQGRIDARVFGDELTVM